MGEPVPGTQPPTRPSEDRLDSWKEIAAYLDRDVTTVQRWEKREGMPVHRHVHDKMGSVYASRVELDAWARGRNIRAADNGRTVLENESDVAPLVEPIPPKTAASTSRTWWTGVFPLALVAAALVIGIGLWLRGKEYFWRNPIADARFQTITDVDAVAQAATVSRDGHFVAFLSDRDGQMTAPNSRTTHLDPEIRCSYQTVSADRKTSPFLGRLPGCTVTFHCGRRMRHSSTSFRVRSQINWTSGAFVQMAELPNGSRRTMGA